MIPVIQKIIPDIISSIAQADNETAYAEVTIISHDVPEDRLTTNFNHRFGPVDGFLLQSRTSATAEDNRRKITCVLVRAPSRSNQLSTLP